MGLINDDQVPVRNFQLLLQRLAAREFVQAGDAAVHLLKDIAADRRFRPVIRQQFKMQAEFLIQLVLPLFGQVSGRHDQAAPEISADHHLFDEQAGHDGLACAWVVRQNIAQRQPPDHFLIHGGYLVRQRLHRRSMNSQIGVKEMGKVDAVSFGDQAHGIAVGIKAPGQSVLQDLETGLILAVNQLIAELAL